MESTVVTRTRTAALWSALVGSVTAFLIGLLAIWDAVDFVKPPSVDITAFEVLDSFPGAGDDFTLPNDVEIPEELRSFIDEFGDLEGLEGIEGDSGLGDIQDFFSSGTEDLLTEVWDEAYEPGGVTGWGRLFATASAFAMIGFSLLLTLLVWSRFAHNSVVTGTPVPPSKAVASPAARTSAAKSSARSAKKPSSSRSSDTTAKKPPKKAPKK